LKNSIKNIFASFVALSLLAGTAGFQVFKHTCTSHNFSAISLLETPECESEINVAEEIDNCCMSEESIKSNCCEVESIDDANEVSVIEFKCCISALDVLKIQDDLFSQIVKEIIFSEEPIYTFSYNKIEKQNLEQSLILQNNNLPPPKFGKKLLNTIHQLKLDIPAC
jgi:hypothetical protein